MHFWMIQSAKKEVFGHYLEFGLLDWLDIAYNDRTKCFSAFDNCNRSWRIARKSQKSIFEWSKVPKMRFLAIFLSLVCWFDLILHILMVLNVFKVLATVRGNEGSFKSHKNAFLNDPKSWFTWFTANILSSVYCIDFILHILILLNGLYHLIMVLAMFGIWIIQ